MIRRDATNSSYFASPFRTQRRRNSGFLFIETFLLLCGFLFASNALAQSSSAVLRGLIGSWPGNGSGTDVVGNNNATLFGGGNYVEGKFERAFGFDGEDDYAYTPFKPDYFFDYNEGRFTLSCWVMPVPYNQPQSIMSIESQESDMLSWNWGIYLNSENHFIAKNDTPARTSASERQDVLTSKTVADANNWYFVALVFNRTECELYVNGEMEASGTTIVSVTGRPNVRIVNGRRVTRTPVPLKGGSVTLGRSVASSKYRYYFRGLIDEAKLFKNALNPAEIKILYTGAVPGVAALPRPGFSAPPPGSATTELAATGIGERYLEGQANGWYGIAISPDGKTLACSDDEQTVSFWDIASGKKRSSVKIWEDDRSRALTSLEFSPDGGTLAVSSGDIFFIDVSKATITDTVKANASCLSLSQDGNLLASSGGYGYISIWQFRTRQLASTWKAGKYAVSSVLFSPDGKTLASANLDGTTTLWTATGQKLKDLMEGERMYSLAFSPDGKTLAGGSDRGIVRLWSLPDGELKHEWKPDSAKPMGYSQAALDFSPNGEILAVGFGSGRENAAQLWNAQTGEVLRSLSVRSVKTLFFSPDGSTLATVGTPPVLIDTSSPTRDPRRPPGRQKVSLWNLQANATQNLDQGTRNQTLVAAQIPDSPQIPAAPSTPRLNTASQIFFHSNRDGNDEIYRMGEGDPVVHRLTNNPANDGGVIPSPDGSQVAFTSNRDGNLEIYVMNSDGTGESRLTNNPANDIVSSWSADGRVAFYSNREGKYHIYFTNAKSEMLAQLTKGKFDDIQPSFSPDGQSVAFASNRSGNMEIHVMRASGQNILQLTKSKATNREPTWSPDGKKIVWSRKESGGNEDIYSMNADGSDQNRLTDYNGKDVRPTFSKNGDKIIFASDRDGNMEIYAMNLNGSNVIRLTNNLANDTDPFIGWVTAPSQEQK